MASSTDIAPFSSVPQERHARNFPQRSRGMQHQLLPHAAFTTDHAASVRKRVCVRARVHAFVWAGTHAVRA